MADEHDERRGSRNEETRTRNLALVLSAVHTSGPQSRSALTRLSGLNRSTIGALVADLVGRGLVVETDPVVATGAGRPSPVVTPHAGVVALAVNPNVGGITCALVGLSGDVRVLETVGVDGAPSPEETAEVASDFLARVREDVPDGAVLAGAGVAVPGLVDEHTHVVRRSPNLQWVDVPLARLVEDRIGLPVAVANDANLGVLAESRFGAGVGASSLVYLNGSQSGVGGGAIVDDVLLRGAHSFASELGHILVNSAGTACACGRTGCLEAEVSLHRVFAAAGSTVELDDLDAYYTHRANAAVNRELDRQVELLARGLATIISVLNPERIILGGHLGALLEARAEVLQEAVAAESVPELAEGVELHRNLLRDRMMSIGAAELAFEALLHDPLGAPLAPLDAVAEASLAVA